MTWNVRRTGGLRIRGHVPISIAYLGGCIQLLMLGSTSLHNHVTLVMARFSSSFPPPPLHPPLNVTEEQSNLTRLQVTWLL